jgi:3-mercaptopyruvate sulfurtransferase SseA
MNMPNRKRNILLTLTVLALAALSCNALLPLPTQENNSTQNAPTQIIEPGSTQPQNNPPQTEDEVPRVDVNVAKTAFDSGQAIIVDVRNPEAYAASHVAGAISIPLEEFEINIASMDLGKEQWIITYCT